MIRQKTARTSTARSATNVIDIESVWPEKLPPIAPPASSAADVALPSVKREPVNAPVLVSLCIRTTLVALLVGAGHRSPGGLLVRSTRWAWDDPTLPAWMAAHSGVANVATATIVCTHVLDVSTFVPLSVLMAMSVADDWATLRGYNVGASRGARQATALLLASTWAGERQLPELLLLCICAASASTLVWAAAWIVPVAALASGVKSGGDSGPFVAALALGVAAAAERAAKTGAAAGAARGAVWDAAMVALLCTNKTYRAYKRVEGIEGTC